MVAKANRIQSWNRYSSISELRPTEGHHVHPLRHRQRREGQDIDLPAPQLEPQPKFLIAPLHRPESKGPGENEEFHICDTETGGETDAVFQSEVRHTTVGSLECN